jgi:NAD-dependent deacetylase
MLRPDVVLFGEMLPEAGILDLKAQLREGFDIVFSVGTTSAFPYISLPVEIAHQRDKPTVEINPGTTRVSSLVRYRLGLGAAVALDAIWKRFQEKHGPG